MATSAGVLGASRPSTLTKIKRWLHDSYTVDSELIDATRNVDLAVNGETRSCYVRLAGCTYTKRYSDGRADETETRWSSYLIDYGNGNALVFDVNSDDDRAFVRKVLGS